MWLRPLRDQLADGCQASSGPPVATAASPDRNEDLKKPPLLCPSTDAKEGALLLFGKEAQRQPHLDSRVWVDGCHPYFSSSRGRTQPQAATPPLLARGSGFSFQRMLVGSSRLEAGNAASNAIKVKLKHVMSQGRPVCGSCLRACRLCEGRDKVHCVCNPSEPLTNSW